MSYDPSWFMEREIYIQELRGKIEDKDCPNVRELFHEVADFYEEFVDLLRVYKTTYDPEEKRRLKKALKKMKRAFVEGVNMIESMVSD